MLPHFIGISGTIPPEHYGSFVAKLQPHIIRRSLCDIMTLSVYRWEDVVAASYHQQVAMRLFFALVVSGKHYPLQPHIISRSLCDQVRDNRGRKRITLQPHIISRSLCDNFSNFNNVGSFSCSLISSAGRSVTVHSITSKSYPRKVAASYHQQVALRR